MILPLAALVLSKPAANLVADGDFGRDPKAFATDYVPAERVGRPGSYAVGKDPQLFHRGGTSMADHTDGRGAMLILNGSTKPDVACWRQTVRVHKGKAYAFTLWAASWGRGINGDADVDPNPARLVVTIDGVPIRPEFTLDRHNGTWSGLSADWTATDSKPVEIRIVDANVADYGNDFALDDIALRQTAR